MAADSQFIKSILLTLKNELVVLPNAAVAEIISPQEVSEIDNAPPWILGKTRWRGTDVPVVSYEAAGGSNSNGAEKINVNTQVAVIYSVNSDEDRKYPFIGLAMHGVPHVSRFNRDQIRMDEEAPSRHPMVAQKVRINGAAAGILDIEAIEKMLDSASV